MKKFAQEWFVEIAAVVVNLVLAIVVLLVSRSSDAISEEAEFLVIGTVASITVLLLFLKSETVNRVRDLSTKVTRIEESVLQTVELSHQIVRDQWFYERLVEIIQAWQKLTDANYHPLFCEYARMRIQDTARSTKGIASGEMTVEASDYRVLSILMNEAQEMVRATSMVSVEFWNSSVGQHYWNLNTEALERDVSITRIFICDEIEPDLETLMSMMHDKGVQVFVAKTSDVPLDLRNDFVVADENLVVKVEVMHENHPLRHHISSKSEDIQKALSDFEKLTWLANEFTGVATQQQSP
jgi:hypothetical protein